MKINRCFGCMAEIQGYPCPQCGYDARSADTASYVLQPGTILNGKYLVGKVLGQGGFGITYIGLDLALERKVAIKEYFPSGQVSRHPSGGSTVLWYTTATAHTAKSSGMEMFIKEARKMTKVSNNPNVVHVLDLFQENETAYIIMDFIEGQTLKDLLKQTGPMHWQDAKKLFLPVIRAMEQVHQAGLIHRDLSPDNLMIQPDGTAKILDLGAAKDLNINSGASSMVVAKGGFSPMEQYVERGGSGPWTDVYSMAATLYYTLTGVVPPSAIERLELDGLNWNAPGLRELPPTAIAGLKRALAVKSRDRTQSMAALLEELQTMPAPVLKSEKEETEKLIDRDVKSPKVWKMAAVCIAAAGLIGIFLSVFLQPNLFQSAGPGFLERKEQMVSYEQNKADIERLLQNQAPECYDYEDGGKLELYFDENRRERCRVFINPVGEKELTFTASYDDAGNMVEECGYEGPELKWRATRSYTSAGELSDEYIYNEERLMRHTQKTYTERGKLSGVKIWGENGCLVEEMEAFFDERGKNTGGIIKDENGKEHLHWNMEYGVGGSLTRTDVYSGGLVQISKFDIDGNLQEVIRNKPDGTLEYRLEYCYDNDGNVISYKKYGADGNLSFQQENLYSNGRMERKALYTVYSDGRGVSQEGEILYAPGDVEIGFRSERTVEEMVETISGMKIQESFANEYNIELTRYTWNGDVQFQLFYDKEGQDRDLIRKIEYRYDASGTFAGYTSQTYKPYADRIETIVYDGNYNVIARKEVIANGQSLTEPWD